MGKGKKLFSSLKIEPTIIVTQTNGHFFMCVQLYVLTVSTLRQELKANPVEKRSLEMCLF